MSAIETIPTFRESYAVEWTWMQRLMAEPRRDRERSQEWGRRYALYGFSLPLPSAGVNNEENHMKTFDIAFTVPEPKLALIVSLLTGEVGALHISESGKVKRRVMNGRESPIRDFGAAFVAGLKAGEVFTKEDFEAALKKNSFKPTNASPTLSVLVKGGKLAKAGRGKFKKV